tara:strand:+ start:238 stop:1374 length:1137 start_codon:yes stop_codon:yes gene_type:complete
MKKQSGLTNERKVQKILVSGSAVLPQKNSAGVRIARKRKPQPASPIVKGYPDLSEIPSDDYGNLSEAGSLNINEFDGGIISGKLIRANYDNTELKKSIDTNIFELIPKVKVELPDTVLRSVYNVVTQSVNDLTIEVQTLTNDISGLNSEISQLEILTESLKIEADNEKLKANIATKQASVANAQISETTIDLSNAIQNSINEAIQRVSLSARNEALSEENLNLREQLFGLAAAGAAGGTVGSSNNVAVIVKDSEVDGTYAMKATTSVNQCKDVNALSVSLDIQNISTTLTITSVAISFVSGTDWFKRKTPATTIPTESTVNIKLDYTQTLKDKIPTSTGWLAKGARDYTGKYNVNVEFDDGSTDSIQLDCKVRKNKNR